MSTYTVAIPPMSDIEVDRFWAKVLPTGFCWEWQAGGGRDGYGDFNIRHLAQSGKFRAHRIAYTLLVGPIPEGLEIDHLCRNRRCCNPDHLEPVTRIENHIRIPLPIQVACGTATGSTPPWVVSGKNITGACIRGHEYTELNTYTYKDGRTECRVCKKANAIAYRAKKLAA